VIPCDSLEYRRVVPTSESTTRKVARPVNARAFISSDLSVRSCDISLYLRRGRETDLLCTSGRTERESWRAERVLTNSPGRWRCRKTQPLEPDQRQTGLRINLLLKVDRALYQYDFTSWADMCLE
jgi:hypothetical protein